MIEKYYASHIKNRLDASVINVRRGATKKRNEEDHELAEGSEPLQLGSLSAAG